MIKTFYKLQTPDYTTLTDHVLNPLLLRLSRLREMKLEEILFSRRHRYHYFMYITSSGKFMINKTTSETQWIDILRISTSACAHLLYLHKLHPKGLHPMYTESEVARI